MSLILEGVDLPKENKEIIIRITDEGTVWERRQGCFHKMEARAIQIERPHGRLIDADKVFCYNFWDEQNIDNAPTILEAEETDENQV